MPDILNSYDFLVVAACTMLLAACGAILGCFSVYHGQSLIGDAIGHSSYPGVVLAFIIFHSREPLLLLAGAAVSGALSYMLIRFIRDGSSIEFDAALAIVLTGMFGFGIALKTYIQGNPSYADASQAGLKSYIFGSAAFLMSSDLKVISITSALILMVIYVFRKILIISIFDSEYAYTLGISNILTGAVLLFLLIITISLGLKSVGVILISSFLLMPCIFAQQHSRRLETVLVIAAIMAAGSAFAGTFLSSVFKGISTGPAIILCMGFAALISMLFGRYGSLKGGA